MGASSSARASRGHIGTSTEPSDAILTVPNILTFVRLGFTPLFLWLALGPNRIDYALGVALVGIATDLADGPIARRTGQVSRLGIRLDPLADRLGLAAAAVVLIAHGLAPLWGVLAVAGRDAALVLVGAPLLAARGAQIPAVSRLGKRASFLVSIAFALFLGSGFNDPSQPIRGLTIAAWAFLIAGLPLYYLAALGYVRAGLSSLRQGRVENDGGSAG